MRDLDRIKERDPNDGGRVLGTVILAVVAFLALSGAVGVVLGRASRTDGVAIERDPLAALEQHDSLLKERPKHAERDYQVNPVALNFPQTLTGKEERPEVLAALSAAAREVAELSNIELGEDVEADAPDMDTAARLSRTMPAAVAAGPAKRTLVQRATHDPMVEAAIPAPEPSVPPAQAGAAGAYTLQVTSFSDADEAHEFSAALRSKGHRAFVTVADVPGRGRFYRVRIGPFSDVYEANRYRALFERAEQMNTFVLSRDQL